MYYNCAASTFETSNIRNYSITSDGKVLTKTRNDWLEGVLLKTTIAQTQVFRFKVLKGSDGVSVGVARDNPLFKGNFVEKCICYSFSPGTKSVSGQEFTMTFDLSNKTVTSSRDGQNLISPFSLDHFGDVQKLRPVVMMPHANHSLEILS